MPNTLPKRLASKITWEWDQKNQGSPHLIWTGAKSGKGYPYIRNEEGKPEQVARVMWRQAKGEKPGYLKNLCGRVDCVSPGHWEEQ